jgi:hypothetical protein
MSVYLEEHLEYTPYPTIAFGYTVTTNTTEEDERRFRRYAIRAERARRARLKLYPWWKRIWIMRLGDFFR